MDGVNGSAVAVIFGFRLFQALVIIVVAGACYGVYRLYRWLMRHKIAEKELMNKVGTEGYLAVANLLLESDNPYRPETKEFGYWERGYRLANRRKQERE